MLYAENELSRALGLAVATPAVSGVSIDGRTLVRGDVFFALRGERYDGARFLAQAFGRGASCAVVSAASSALSEGHDPSKIVRTADALEALERLATYARTRTRARIVAVTGSVGKTSTRAALEHILSGKVCASHGNLNNHIGLPLSLARMAGDCDYGVFELAMSAKGEIESLAKLARPHAALITAIAPAHLAFFHDEAEISDAKAEIFSVQPQLALLPADGEFGVRLLRSAEDFGVPRIATFGTSRSSDYRLLRFALEGDKTRVDVRFPEGRTLSSWRIGGLGRARALVGLAALGMADMLGEAATDAAAKLASLYPLRGRGAVQEIRLHNPDRVITLLDESYNSSPSALRVALETLSEQGRRRIAVLGDMLELGEQSAQIHKSFAATVAQHCDLVFTAGALMQQLHEALPQTRRGLHAEESHDLIAPLIFELRDGDALLVKGSLASGMVALVCALEAGDTAAILPRKRN